MELSRSKISTSIQVKGVKGGRSYFLYAFTEQGVAMLASVLKSDTAVQTSIMIIVLVGYWFLPSMTEISPSPNP